MDWKVYIILCSDSTLYTGITIDIEKRFTAHNNQTGAKYFRGRSPEKIIYLETGYDRSMASKRESVIKKLSRIQKMQLIESELNEVKHG